MRRAMASRALRGAFALGGRVSVSAARRGRTRVGRTCETRAVSGGARATRAVPMRVVCVSKGGGRAFDECVAEYAERCKRYAPFDEVQAKQNPKNVKDNDMQKEHEGERVMKCVSARDFVVLMDERGDEVSSEQLAALVAKIGDEGYERAVFVIGGPFGHGSQVIDRANAKIRLSKMVLNHQVARLVLVEALYRSWTILRGEPYHH